MSAALRFLALGALLFAGRLWWDAFTPPLSPRDRGPRGEGQGEGIDVLSTAAAALDLAAADPVVARRLRRNSNFLAADAAALGLTDSDLVVRRRLATRLRLAIESAARAAEPSEVELHAYLTAQAARFAVPPRVRLRQVYLSRARRGAALAADARRLRARLVDGAAVAGDALPVSAVLPLMTAAELEGLLGAPLAAAAFAAPLGAWSEPVASRYGLHLLRVAERRPAETPPLASVRAAVREALLAARADAAVAAALDELRAAR